MPVHVKDAGVWKQATPFIRDGGVWKAAALSVKDAGVWKAAAANDTISISDVPFHQVFGFDPQTKSAGYKIANDGNVYLRAGAGDDFLEAWVTPASNAALYEVRATLVSGALSSGNLTVWQLLNADALWTVTQPGVGSATATFDVEIRKSGTTTVLDTARVTIEALVEA